MSDRSIYQSRIQKRLDGYHSLLITIGVISLLGAITVYAFVDLVDSPAILLALGQIAIILLISAVVLSVIGRSWLVTVLSIVGVMLILGSLFYPVREDIPSTYNELDTYDPDDKYKVKHLVWRYEPAHALTPTGSSVMFYLGVGILGVSMIIVYKPSLLYVKNRPSDDPPYPIWDSKHSYTTYRYRHMVPLLDLLYTSEKYMLSQYRYVHVRIGDKVYLVTPNSLVPDDSEVLRDRTGKFFLGVPRTQG
ncbi:MAG: hypothetical protein ACE5KA_03790 [Nitrososphaerales archaeon]